MSCPPTVPLPRYTSQFIITENRKVTVSTITQILWVFLLHRKLERGDEVHRRLTTLQWDSDGQKTIMASVQPAAISIAPTDLLPLPMDQPIRISVRIHRTMLQYLDPTVRIHLPSASNIAPVT